MHKDDYKWAIAGTGYIAHNFADAMPLVKGAAKTAVCGTSLEKAEKFKGEFGFELSYGNYEEMLEKSGADIVYIAVPNMLHYDMVMKALDAGKNVLCEKPMGDNLKQIKAMINKAEEKGLFLMEALWTRCFPATKKVNEWIESGKIGKLKTVRSGFGLKAAPGWQGWKAMGDYAGGAVRDVGVYTMSMAFLGFKKMPQEVISTVEIRNGADYHSELLFKYSGGGTAYLTNSFDMITDYNTAFYGDEGIAVLGRTWDPSRAELFTYEGGDEFNKTSVEVFEDPYPSTGMQYEISHVQKMLDECRKQSNLFPLKESLEICEIIDNLRKEWGVVYPSER